MYFSNPKNTNEMVEQQIQSRNIEDIRVISAMKEVPREKFVPPKYKSAAYADQPLPIGFGQTISQPYIVAFMTEQLHLTNSSKVLEIGTGCGYQTAILAKIVKQVYSIELIDDLAELAEKNLHQLNIKNVTIKCANGREGWQKHAPFSHIIVAAGSKNIPENLINQLEPGGKMIIPVGNSVVSQNLLSVIKQKKGYKSNKILPVRFVPLIEK